MLFSQFSAFISETPIVHKTYSYKFSAPKISGTSSKILTVPDDLFSFSGWRNQLVQRLHWQKPFCCVNCGKQYIRRDSLYKHIRYECGTVPKFVCVVCGRRFKHKHHLSYHLTNTHKVKWSVTRGKGKIFRTWFTEPKIVRTGRTCIAFSMLLVAYQIVYVPILAYCTEYDSACRMIKSLLFRTIRNNLFWFILTI